MQFIVEDAPDLTIPEDTIVRARLEEIKEHRFEWTDKKTGERKEGHMLQWWWEVTAENEYNGRKIKGECDAKISSHPRNRFRGWAETLLGRELPPGMPIDTDDLVGLSADISIRHDKDKKDPSKVYERVDEVIPITGAFDVGAPPF